MAYAEIADLRSALRRSHETPPGIADEAARTVSLFVHGRPLLEPSYIGIPGRVVVMLMVIGRISSDRPRILPAMGFHVSIGKRHYPAPSM